MNRQLDLKEILNNSDHLPTIPAVANQLLSVRDWENIDLDEVAEIISKDVSLSSRILQAANSPFYGFAHRIGTVSHALVALGIRATRSLALSFSLVKMTPGSKTSRFDYAGFWTRSINTAVAARELSLVAGLQASEEAFLAGLLQNIGVMVLGQCASDAYDSILKEADKGMLGLPEMEREAFGIDHVQVAKALFDRWNLPSSLCIPVLYHHAPEEAARTDEQTLLSVRIQYLAGCIGDWLYTNQSECESLEQLRTIAAHHLGIAPDELDALLYRVDMRMAEISGVFELQVSRPKTYAQLLEKANLTLGDIVNEQERLLKELEAAKLEARRLTEQLRVANSRLLDEARTDSLTGLANRRRFDEFLKREMERSLCYNHPISLLFIDLDDLKSVNDRHGHLEGSNAIKHLADILRARVRTSDMVARYGGDEFVIALVETDCADAQLPAERIRRAIEREPYFLKKGQEMIHLTASVGVASWEPQDKPLDPDTLIEHADAAMYQAKKAGKNRISIFHEAIESSSLVGDRE